MTVADHRHRRPPRLVVRTLFATPAAIVSVVSVVTPVLVWTLQDHAALAIVLTVGAGAVLPGVIASVWLARTLTEPIDQLSRSLTSVARGRVDPAGLVQAGAIRELDAPTTTVNDLIASLQSAEAEARSAYVGAIKALAAALDARDPHTAGHSERVSALAVALGRQLQLGAVDLEVLRLGGLLHDIGKIGVSDEILRKAGPLSSEEFEAIKAHPRLGSHILRSVPFLAPHLAIVELHHERPDGHGYPHGLAGDDIPLSVRIVRVADAFDAMTSDRAYRAAGPPADALAELRRTAGSQFDAAVVEALAAAWPSLAPSDGRESGRAGVRETRVRPLLGFPRPAAGIEPEQW